MCPRGAAVQFCAAGPDVHHPEDVEWDSACRMALGRRDLVHMHACTGE